MIQLVLSNLPIDEIPGHAILVTYFEDLRPLKGASSLVDWRLNGRISELILGHKITGAFGESLIMPSQGRMSAREIFLFGLGKLENLNERTLEDGFQVMIEKILRLKSSELILSFGDLAKDFMSWRSLLRAFMTTLAAAPFEMQILCAEDSKWINEAKRRNMDFGANIELRYA